MDGDLNVVIIVAATLVACEIMLRLPFHSVLLRFSGYVGKAKSTLCSNKISDNWKGKVLPVYSGKIFIISLELLAFILIVLCPFAAVGVLSPGGFPRLINSLSSFKVSVSMPVVAVVYIFLRKKLLQ